MFPEETTRLRCRQFRGEAERARLPHRIAAVRFWRRLARFASRRAERYERRI
ncbi:hypothetical protein SAMN04487820_101453 [Actinopolyspora mzabensis]|uniref:Uncharacterized protein n=1 Tax=Actinopolyspora mzabensis TaxID=995066 RepID=A0A1G8W102_ACTMZ|nr:hypothetical protein SAMN04487820_101453 [Actinopolyspora mzabensis]